MLIELHTAIKYAGHKCKKWISVRAIFVPACTASSKCRPRFPLILIEASFDYLLLMRYSHISINDTERRYWCIIGYTLYLLMIFDYISRFYFDDRATERFYFIVLKRIQPIAVSLKYYCGTYGRQVSKVSSSQLSYCIALPLYLYRHTIISRTFLIWNIYLIIIMSSYHIYSPLDIWHWCW
jgi:hypothetical protein